VQASNKLNTPSDTPRTWSLDASSGKDGNRFSVRIDLRVPGEELTVTHGSNVHGSKQHLDEEEWVKKFDVEGMRKHPRLVIKEAFDVARRRLQDYTRLRRHAVKTHEKREQGAA